ncbi:MAG: type II toxin-antitoxin system prevent-host-death family antitoxin [Candidatus Omnitrophica bacterium]|nr:type II toxin-antitoxin system prevent-host-death family antitoxin [Candidatus Omnitrophota bacterium]
MVSVNTHQAKTKLSALLAAVQFKGERVIICRHGTPVAELTPFRGVPKDPFHQDPALKKVIFKGSPMDPLDDEEWSRKIR